MSNGNIKPTRFYGQGKPPLDKQLFDDYLPNRYNGFFIECGAADGVGYSNTLFFELELDWNGILIEASPKQFKALEINRPKTLNLLMGLSDNNTFQTFTDVVSAPGGGEGNGAFGHVDWHMEELLGYRCVFKKYNLPTITYRNLINIFDVQHVDLFSLDVEGHELQVLAGMRECKVLPDVICVEHSISGQKNIIRALPDYKLDGENYVNSIFIKR